MVWFVHSLIVYVISLRVEIVWQSKLISGFSSAANFLAFAVTTRLLWPSSPKAYLFMKQKQSHLNDDFPSLNSVDEDDDTYDGLEMRSLGEQSK